MAVLSASILSVTLGFDTHIQVIIPQNPASTAPVEKVLYLLHGLSGSSTCWLHKTRIRQYAEEYGYMVVMPEVQRSFYTDMAHGSKYFTYVAHELPSICEQLFNIRHVREKTFVAGLSMGGYGAAKCGFGRPDFYAACASLSGAVDMKTYVEMAKESEELRKQLPEMPAILGMEYVMPDKDDLFYLVKDVVKLAERPKVLLTCGASDFLLDHNRRFDAHLQALNYGHTYMEWPGDHDWDFWEECLPLVFDFFEKAR